MDVLASKIRASRKIAMKADESAVNLSRRLTGRRIRRLCDGIYDELIDTEKYLTAVRSDYPPEIMELNRNAAFIRGLGDPGFKSSVFLFDKEALGTEKGGYFVLFPGANSERRRWSAQSYAGVLDHIFSRTSLSCLVCGSENEKPILDEIISYLKPDNCLRVKDYMGRTTLLELSEVIRKASFLLGNDTGGIHMAVSVGVPSICIAGESHIGRFIPYMPESHTDSPLPVVVHAGMNCKGCVHGKKTFSCLWSVFIKRHFECILRITEQDVISVLDKGGFLENG